MVVPGKKRNPLQEEQCSGAADFFFRGRQNNAGLRLGRGYEWLPGAEVLKGKDTVHVAVEKFCLLSN